MGSSLSAAFALLVDSLASERSELMLHGIGDEDADCDQDEEDDEDDRDGDVAFHHLERWGPVRGGGKCMCGGLSRGRRCAVL